MGGLRDYLREQINPQPTEQVSGSRQLAEYARGMQEWEADRQARLEAEAAEAAKPPPPPSLPEQLKAMIGHQEPRSWKDVRADLDRRTEARKQPAQQSVADALREALGEQEQHETPSLNDPRLLTVLGSVDSSHTTKETVAKILHDHRAQSQ
jgi:type IV secretory pathway VirB10-like protein